MTFQECKTLIQSKFDFQIELTNPQKLCDYKCAYGLIFEKFLSKYDWWGYCDLDQIFGDIGAFITEDMLENYNRIGSIGHFTLYRNTLENCRIFTNVLNGKERYKEVFTTDRGCAFDEWLPDNVNDIYIQSGSSIFLENFGADINPYYTQFSTVTFDIDNRKYIKSNIKNSIFMFENGKLFQIYDNNGKQKKIEYPYIHLQKRKMTDMRSDASLNEYYIIPNCFVDKTKDSMELLSLCKKWRILNYQYFKVKWQSLKYRIKNGDWHLSNVFRM